MNTPEVTVKTPSGEFLFASLEGRDEISTCFEFRLRLVSTDPDIKAEDLLGLPVTVVLGRDEPIRHFHGLVADFGFVEMRQDKAVYGATLRPALWLLSLSTDNRIFQNKSTVEIVEEVLGEYSALRFSKSLRKSYPPREYCVQYGESDLAFVQRLLEDEGILYYFVHDESGHEMVLADDSTALKPPEGLDTIQFHPFAQGNMIDEAAILSWLPVASVRTGKYTQTDYDFEKPSTDLMSKAEHAFSHAETTHEAYHYPGNYLVFAQGDTRTKTRLDEVQAPHRRVQATASTSRLHAGTSFTLEDFPRAAENDAYIVLAAEYRVWEGMLGAAGAGQGSAGPGSAGQGSAGQSPEDAARTSTGARTTLTLQPAAIPFRPARRTPWPQMKGPQTAKVVGPAGEEIFTDKYSRVKVQFPWDRLGGHDENSTCFVRVSSVWAGAGWGFIQIPRIGQEVIVDFLEGNPDRPIITGRVYNAEQMPPYGLPANATQSGWKSNSSPGGGGFNEMRFEDKKGSEQVYFQAEKDHVELVKNDETRTIGHDWVEDVGNDATQSIGHDRTESVGNDKSTSVGHDRTVSIGNDDSETVGNNRSLTVGVNETISVGADTTETIGANCTQNIGASHSQTVGLNQTVTVAVARTDTVGAAETRTVGATQTMSIGGTRTVSVGSNQTHNVGGNDATSVGGGQTLSVGKDQTVSVGAKQGISVAADRSLSVGGKDAVSIAKDGSISSGAKFALSAKDEITITCGDASITLKKDGTISIKGKDISLTGSGKITAKADSDVKINGSKVHMN